MPSLIISSMMVLSCNVYLCMISMHFMIMSVSSLLVFSCLIYIKSSVLAFELSISIS